MTYSNQINILANKKKKTNSMLVGGKVGEPVSFTIHVNIN